ncbi:MAG: lipoyl(octanoyl) transferase LipB [candidate division NC10 bacterium]|nr:lipoyl(octanoyl) transferase LipB [candidate division NC10 bacterium]
MSEVRCIVQWLGRVEYGKALELQRQWASARTQGLVEDCLLLVEHPPVITLGRGAKRRHLLADDDVLRTQGIEVWETERGGDVTFHGPGQLVGYPILDLTRHGKDLHHYMRRLEELLIRTLHRYGIHGERSAGQTGVWVHGTKIASIGVHVSRWVSRHGFSLNVSPDLSAFDLIVPCGLSGVRMTSMSALLNRPVPVQTVAEAVAEQFTLVFDCAMEWRSSPEPVLSLP